MPSTDANTAASLADCHEQERADITRWTHEPSGAYVELIRDDCPSSALEDGEGVAISYREGDHCRGTLPDHPRYPTVPCEKCDGDGYILADGAAPPLGADDRQCAACDASGQRDATLEEWCRAELDAVAIYEFDTGSHGEASAVIVITDSDWTNPAVAARGWADEYQRWADGDVWGIRAGGPGVQPDDCWGFIGREYAEQTAATEYLPSAIEEALHERAEAAHWAARDVLTHDADHADSGATLSSL